MNRFDIADYLHNWHMRRAFLRIIIRERNARYLAHALYAVVRSCYRGR